MYIWIWYPSYGIGLDGIEKSESPDQSGMAGLPVTIHKIEAANRRILFYDHRHVSDTKTNFNAN